jgi:hypothetical protein
VTGRSGPAIPVIAKAEASGDAGSLLPRLIASICGWFISPAAVEPASLASQAKQSEEEETDCLLEHHEPCADQAAEPEPPDGRRRGDSDARCRRQHD